MKCIAFPILLTLAAPLAAHESEPVTPASVVAAALPEEWVAE